MYVSWALLEVLLLTAAVFELRKDVWCVGACPVTELLVASELIMARFC